MPSWDYLPRYQDDLALVERWQVDGDHYARTLRAWLDNLDRRRDLVMPVLEQHVRYRTRPGCGWPTGGCSSWPARRRSPSASGTEYFVAHYLFVPR